MFCFILYFILGFLKFYFKIILFNFIWVLDPIEKKIFFCVPKKIIQVWNNMTVSKWHLLKVFQNFDIFSSVENKRIAIDFHSIFFHTMEVNGYR